VRRSGIKQGTWFTSRDVVVNCVVKMIKSRRNGKFSRENWTGPKIFDSRQMDICRSVLVDSLRYVPSPTPLSPLYLT
jgi:hypothetical protein